MSNIIDLPLELSNNILERLPVWDAKDGYQAASCKRDEVNSKALYAVTMSCKRLRMIAEPFLYRVFVSPEAVVQRRNNKDGSSTWTADCTILRKFLRTILARPQLGLHVKTLVIYNTWNLTAQPTNGKHAETPRWLRTTRLERGQYRAAVQTLITPGLPMEAQHKQEEQRWLQDLRRGTADAQLALLLTQLPYLNHLALVPPEGMEDSDDSARNHRHTVFSVALTSRPNWHVHRFPFLQRCTLLDRSLNDEDLPYMQSSRCMSELFHLHTLSILDGFIHRTILDMLDYVVPALVPMADEEIVLDQRARYQPLLSRQSNISSLDLAPIHAVYDHKYSTALIETCKDLRKFSFTYLANCRADVPYEHEVYFYNVAVWWIPLIRSLIAHRSTLQQLTLEFSDDTGLLPNASLGTPDRFESFQAFEVLKDLRIHQSVIVPSVVAHTTMVDGHAAERTKLLNILPSSLENFSVSGLDNALANVLQPLLRERPSSLPRLKTMRLEIGHFRVVYSASFDDVRAMTAAAIEARSSDVILLLCYRGAKDISPDIGRVLEQDW